MLLFTLTAIIWRAKKKIAKQFLFQTWIFRNIVKVGNECKRKAKLLPSVTCMFCNCIECGTEKKFTAKDFLFKTSCALLLESSFSIFLVSSLSSSRRFSAANSEINISSTMMTLARWEAEVRVVIFQRFHCLNSIITYLHKWCDSCLLSLSLNVMNFRVIKWSTMRCLAYLSLREKGKKRDGNCGNYMLRRFFFQQSMLMILVGWAQHESENWREK